MRAQAKIWISIAVSIAVSGVIAYFAFSLVREMSHDFARYQGYSEIINEASALNILIDEALKVEVNARTIQQIGQVRGTLSKSLGSISSSNSPEESLIRQIRRNNLELGPLIEQLFEPMEASSGGMDTERRNLLASQLRVKVRFITDDVNRLMETSGTRIVSAQAKASLIVLILFGVVILATSSIYFFSSRSIVRAQEALRESQRQAALLADLLEISSQPFGTGFPDGRLGMCNTAFPRLLGYSKEEFFALNWGKDLTPPEWLEKEASILEELQRTGQPVRYEKEYRRKDGTRVPVELLVHLRRNEQGEPAYYYAFVTDITARRQAEKELRESREDLNRAQVVAHTGSWRLNVQKNALTWSDENHRIFGIPPETPLTYETFLGTVHPEDREYVDREWMAALKGEPYDIEHRISVDGTVKWVRERAELEFNPEGQLLGGFGTTQDITERKQVEEEIKRLASFPRMNPSPVLEIDATGAITFYNQAALEAIHQLGPEAKLMDLLPKDIGEIGAAARQKREQVFYREIKIKDMVFGQTIAFTEAFDVLRIYSMDITRRRRAEEELQQTLADLERSNRELEEFAYISSHDLQEPLRQIANFSEMLAKEYKERLDERAVRYFGYITIGAKRMQSLINDVLSFSLVDQGEIPQVPASLEDVLIATLKDLQTLIRESGAEISYDSLPTLKVNANQMGLLLQNLIANAIKFRNQQSPRIRLSASQEGGEWLISLRDNGIGFDSHYAESIFKVFKRMHSQEKYPGTGIGLAICKKIVERHGGRIWAESQPGQGATFYFTIPA
jgi:PAS domain S-box-containing protein